MKVTCFIALTLCAFAQSSVSIQNIPGYINSYTNLGYTHLELNLLAPDSEFSAEDQLLIDALTALEITYGRSLIADTIKDVLEGFRDTVINGNENLPPLDPLIIESMGPFQYTTTGVRASASIHNFNVDGLRWYVVDHVTFNAIRLTLGLHLTIPRLTVTGSYDAEARVALLLTHRAGGNFRVFLNRFEVGVDMRLGTNILGGGHLILRELNIKLDIHDTHIQITGMTGSSLINTFINTFVQNLTQEIIQNELENVSQTISEELFDIINDILKDFTLNDILG